MPQVSMHLKKKNPEQVIFAKRDGGFFPVSDMPLLSEV